MRIRRKKRLNERLSGVKDILVVPDRDIVNVNEAVKNKKYFDYVKLFGNNNPVNIEIGCGKGRFIIETAKRNPNENFLAVELLENIVVMAAEAAIKECVENVRFINSGAEYLPRYIRENSIKTVYLNFSPPYPKCGYENRRLTCGRMVERYKAFLVPGGRIYQKTDDVDFFNYSFEKFNEFGFSVVNMTDELNGGKTDNIETEYEMKFKALGLKVFSLIAEKE